MASGELLYEGKAKQIYSTGTDREYLIRYKDDATAFDGTKRASSPTRVSSTIGFPICCFSFWRRKASRPI